MNDPESGDFPGAGTRVGQSGTPAFKETQLKDDSFKEKYPSFPLKARIERYCCL